MFETTYGTTPALPGSLLDDEEDTFLLVTMTAQNSTCLTSSEAASLQCSAGSVSHLHQSLWAKDSPSTAVLWYLQGVEAGEKHCEDAVRGQERCHQPLQDQAMQDQ